MITKVNHGTKSAKAQLQTTYLDGLVAAIDGDEQAENKDKQVDVS